MLVEKQIFFNHVCKIIAISKTIRMSYASPVN